MQKTLGRTTRRVKTSSGGLSSCIHWNSMQVLHLCKYIVAKSPIIYCIFTKFQCNLVFVLWACQQQQYQYKYMLYGYRYFMVPKDFKKRLQKSRNIQIFISIFNNFRISNNNSHIIVREYICGCYSQCNFLYIFSLFFFLWERFVVLDLEVVI